MASMSGVELTDRSKHLYEEIYKGKKHRYVVFAIKDGKIDAETIGDLEKTYDEFLVDVKKETDAGKKDCRFAVYDYEYTFLPDGTTEPQWKSKIFLLCWCPDDGPIKGKMLYSSSFDTLKKAFQGVKKAIQANCEADIEQSAVEEALREADRT